MHLIAKATVLAALLSSLPAATVEGTITFEKAVPAGMLAWVPGVVRAAAPAPVSIDQKDKVFTPTVVAVRPGSTVTIRNSDGIQHNAYGSDKSANGTFDTGLNAPNSDTPLTVGWPAGKVVKLGCKIHPGMQMWIAALDSDAWVVPAGTAAAPKIATFTIADVPADAAKVVLWTSKYGELELDLKASGSATGSIGPAERPAATVSVQRKP